MGMEIASHEMETSIRRSATDSSRSNRVMPMYRIELRAGEEASYKTFEEFAQAVKAGTISSRARIWHAASSKWLPIDFHPHYKRAVSAPKTASVQAPAPAPAPIPVPAPKAAAPASAPPKDAPKSGELEFLEIPELLPQAPRAVAGSLFRTAPAPAPAPHHIEVLAAAAEDASADAAHPENNEEVLIDISRPGLSPVAKRAIGVVAAVVVLAGTAGVLLTRTPSGKSAAPAPDTTVPMASTSLAATPSSSFEVVATSHPAESPHPDKLSQPTIYMPMPAIPNAPAPKPAPDSGSVLPAAPRVGPLAPSSVAAASTSAAALSARYEAAHGAAAEALETRLRASGIGSLFSSARLAGSGVSDARLTVAGIANFIRTFRTRDKAVETAYRDSAAQLATTWSDSDKATWQKVAAHAESAAAAHSADQLLTDISSLLGVLDEQSGSYDLSDGKVTFRDAGATLRYGTLRRRVAERLTSGDSGSAVTGTLLKVIGSARPPVENFSE